MYIHLYLPNNCLVGRIYVGHPGEAKINHWEVANCAHFLDQTITMAIQIQSLLRLLPLVIALSSYSTEGSIHQNGACPIVGLIPFSA